MCPCDLCRPPAVFSYCCTVISHRAEIEAIYEPERQKQTNDGESGADFSSNEAPALYLSSPSLFPPIQMTAINISNLHFCRSSGSLSARDRWLPTELPQGAEAPAAPLTFLLMKSVLLEFHHFVSVRLTPLAASLYY